MTDVGDNAAQAPRRQLGTPPPPAPAPTPQAPTQEIRRPGSADGPPRYEETGRTFPVPPASGASPPTGAAAPSGHGSWPGGSTVTEPVPSDAERQKALKAQQKAAARVARKAAARRPQQTRRAKLRLTRVDPWSVTKTAFLLSIAFGVMCVVAVFLVFSVMSASGLWDKVNETIQSVVNQDPASRFDIKDYVAMSRVMGLTMLISVIDVVLFTALATLGAFIYNMAAAMLGGVEITLAEDLD